MKTPRFLAIPLAIVATLSVASRAAPATMRFALGDGQTSISAAGVITNLVEQSLSTFNSASIRADATAGSINARSESTHDLSVGASASVGVQDQFVVSGPPAGTAFNIALHARLTGSLDAGPSGFVSGSALVIANVQALFGLENVGAPEARDQFDFRLASPFNGTTFDRVSQPITEILTITLAGRTEQPFGLEYTLNADAFSIGTADFFSTFDLSFDLPDGVTVSSSSGFSQTGGPTAIPEPTTMVLLGSGVVALAIHGRRRYRRRRPAVIPH
jgi:hypothetical protein